MKTFKGQIKKNIMAYIFLMPWLLFFIIFMVIPFFMGIYYSFFDYDFVNFKFIGLENYKYILTDSVFLKSITNTLLIASTVIVLTMCISLLLASIIVTKSSKIQTITKAAIYVPAVTSSVAIVVIWKWIFGPAMGISSSICAKLGITSIDWFGTPILARILVCLLVLFFSLGQPVVLFTAAINAIPKSYYESADIDGASKRKQFFMITLPLIKPTILYVLVTSTVALFQVFEVPILLTAGGPQYSTTTILLLLYRTAFEFGKFGRAAAMGVILFLMIGIIAVFQFKQGNSDVEY